MLKLSGEILMGGQPFGIEQKKIKSIAGQLIEVAKQGIQIVVEIGGGNIYRWRTAQKGVSRGVADYMGMMGSTMNALNIESYNNKKIKALSTIFMPAIVKQYTPNDAVKYLEKGFVVIIGGGTGSQYFTTDTGAVVHALQIGCDVVFKGTKVKGIYDSDPKKNSKAKKYEKVTYDLALENKLGVMDMTAFALCRENNLPIIIFDATKEGNIEKAVAGKEIGTKVEK